jgi:uncharacterized membrane protein YuzA (DUF378 family)
MFLGAINLGIYGLYNIDILATVFSPASIITRIVYVIIGLSAFINILLGVSTIECDLRYHKPEHS